MRTKIKISKNKEIVVDSLVSIEVELAFDEDINQIEKEALKKLAYENSLLPAKVVRQEKCSQDGVTILKFDFLCYKDKYAIGLHESGGAEKIRRFIEPLLDKQFLIQALKNHEDL